MTFGHPYLLLLLLLLPLLAWLQGRRGPQPAFVYSSVRLLEGITGATRSRAGQFLATARCLALGVLIFALAQPRLTKTETSIKASGVDIVAALDLSGSMEVPDFVFRGRRINRLTLAKEVLERFIEKRPNDRIGLVAFGGRAYIASPLTLDHDFLEQNVERLHLHMIEDNTAIGSGLATSVNRLRDLKAKSKIVILMTDGRNNAGRISPLNAAEAARALGIKVYTIGVGNSEFVMRMGLPLDCLPDEETLQEIARLTGGRYSRADNTQRFQEIYAEIDRLEKTQAEVKKFARHQELFPWIVATGVSLLLLEVVLSQTVWRRLP